MEIGKQPYFHLSSTPSISEDVQTEQHQSFSKTPETNNPLLHPYSSLLPLTIPNLLTIPSLSWSQFPGPIQTHLPYHAHIYWNIQYSLSPGIPSKLSLKVQVLPKSWVKPQHKKSCSLLNHQQGHLLIGYLCALEFAKIVQKKRKSGDNYVVGDVFNKTLKKYQMIERNYDEETKHMEDEGKQREWDEWIGGRLKYYQGVFEGRGKKEAGRVSVKKRK